MDAAHLFWLAPAGSLLALVYAYYFYTLMKQSNPGSEKNQEIAGYIKEGAKSYLLAQYKVVGLFFIIAFAFFAFLAFVLEVQSPWTPIAFLTGGFFSALSGYLGMKTATNASSRTAVAAGESLNSALQIAFRSGAVMGFVVVGLGLLDISIWWKILNYVLDNQGMFKDSIFAVHSYTEITTIMLTFGMGASSQALFARVGGGIFTKAADIGADLVAKTEADIPEDDPRNPAVIADNVGDNVGDVAGMGADLYESYCGSILATAALGAAAFNTPELLRYQLNSILLPMAIAGIGIVFSIFGSYGINTKEDASQRELMKSLNRGVNFAAFFTAVGSVALVNSLLPNHFQILGSIISGLMAGIIIGWATNYYTSEDYKPTFHIADQSSTGPATVIIEGIATGMISTAIPVITVCFAILLAYGFAGGFENPAMGLYGIGIAAVGMLSTLGITLATDAYGPIADNAGGNAQMSGMSPEVRKRTDALDSLGNTTAATGKGFAIGSAALTALALLGAYIEEIRMALIRVANFSGSELSKYIYTTEATRVPLENATMHDFMNYYNINLMNPIVLVGVFIGSMLVFVFSALSLKAVGRAAHNMVEEVRRQFKDIPGLLNGEAKADYSSCVSISTYGAQKEMVTPSLIAIIIPIIVSLFLGVAGVVGMLAGGLTTGFVLAIMMSNAGGAWDNAKKFIESGEYGGKGSDCHKATVIGDTVGDPFKDTAGPSLNILIKLMSMVAIVVAGLTVNYSPVIQDIIGFAPTELTYKKEYAKTHGLNDLDDLTLLKRRSSAIYEDPLLGTEDIILPTDEDMLRAKKIGADKYKPDRYRSLKPSQEEIQQAVEKRKADNAANGIPDNSSKTSADNSGFGGGFDSFDEPKTAGSSNTSSGFDGGFDSFDNEPKTTNKTDTNSGFGDGFDSFDNEQKAPAKTDTNSGFDGGFDSFDNESKAAEKSDTNSGFDGGFDSFDTPKKASEKPTDNGGFSGFDSFDNEPAATEAKPVSTENPVKPEAVAENQVKTEESTASAPITEPTDNNAVKAEQAPATEAKTDNNSVESEKAPKEEAKSDNSPVKSEETPAVNPIPDNNAVKAEEVPTTNTTTETNAVKPEDAPKTETAKPEEASSDSFSGGFDAF